MGQDKKAWEDLIEKFKHAQKLKVHISVIHMLSILILL